MEITIKLDELLTLSFIRHSNGSWKITGTQDGADVNLTATDEQAGAMLFLCAAGNPKNEQLDNDLYELLDPEHKESGIVP